MAFQDRKSGPDAIAPLVILGRDKVQAFVSGSFLETNSMSKNRTKSAPVQTITAFDPQARARLVDRLYQVEAEGDATFWDRVESVNWVRGGQSRNRAFGVAYVNGKLCEVRIERSKPGVLSEPITLHEAAKKMREVLEIEIMVGSDIEMQITDAGLEQFYRDLEAATA